MEWVYLGALLFSIGGLLMLDHKFKLAFWKDTKRAALSLSTAIAIFIVWDFFGISLGIFFHGGSPYALPYRIAPEFPIEEIVFLFLLTYSALITYHGVLLWRSRTSS